jgi:hypothetical protein
MRGRRKLTPRRQGVYVYLPIPIPPINPFLVFIVFREWTDEQVSSRAAKELKQLVVCK